MRPLTTDDLLRREEVGEVALSPDGRWLAYVVKRPRLTARFHKYDFLAGGDRGDVWLVSTSGGEPRNLTDGAGEGWGYWAPAWSPESSRLSMLSTRAGNVRPWVFDVSAGTLSCASERGVDLGWRGRSSLWISDERLLIAALPEGERPTTMTVEFRAAETAIREWPKAWSGEAATASVLDSGTHAPFGERPQGELLIFDAASGERRSVMTGFFRELRPSPDGSHIAFARKVEVRRPQPDQALSPHGEQRVLGVVASDGAVVVDAIEIDGPLMGSHRWSPDGAELAVIGREGEAPARAFRYRPADGRLEPASPPGLEPISLMWAAGGLLVLAGPAHGRNEPEKMSRRHWWLFRGGEEPRNLTAGEESVPRALIAEEGLASFVGLADGNVFRVSVEDGGCTSLTASFDRKVASIVWPSATAGGDQIVRRLVLAVTHEGANQWHSLDLRSGELSPLSKPATRASILGLAPEHDTAVLGCADRTGNRLWLSKPAFERDEAILEKNTWLADVGEGEVRRIDYVSLDGDELQGWLMLPVGYRQGTRCPLVTEVYPGWVVPRDASVPEMLSINGHHCLNRQLLAARGFAVLFPSMPLKPQGEAGDPFLELTKGVMPAVDETIELGIADPARLGLMGQSFGGYATYGLVTQTTRFHAAVALAGLSNLASLYGQFDARVRYDDHPHEHTFQASLMEAGQGRIGGTPWKNAAGYERNSPLFYADRVETPLLIIQGDMDYVAIQQGEELFAALYRQDKRARFVRYWGEGHVLAGPPNIRDMWNQIHAWFDEHLAPNPGCRPG